MTISPKIRRPDYTYSKTTGVKLSRVAERDENEYEFDISGSMWQTPTGLHPEFHLEDFIEYYNREHLDHFLKQRTWLIYGHAAQYKMATIHTTRTVDQNLLTAGRMRIRYAYEEGSIYAMIEDIVRKLETDAVFTRSVDELRIELPYDDDYDNREDAVYDKLNAELTGREQRDVRFVVCPDEERDDWELLREACNEPRGNPPRGFKELFDGIRP